MSPETAYLVIAHYIICSAGLFAIAAMGVVISHFKKH